MADAPTSSQGLMSMFPVTAIAGIFGATQEARAAKEAMRILNEARQGATQSANMLQTLFSPLVSAGQEGVLQARRLLGDLNDMAMSLDLGSGLSGADMQSYRDASRLFKETMVNTGNLRSGAHAYGQAELMSRIVANAQERRFNRDVTKLNLLYGGAGTIGQQGLNLSQVGTQGLGLMTSMRNAILGLAPTEAQAAVNKGSALSNQVVSAGRATDELWHTGLAAYKSLGGGVDSMSKLFS